MTTKEMLGEKLRQIRKETGLNQLDFFEKYFADKVEIPPRKTKTKDKEDDSPSEDTKRRYMGQFEAGTRSIPADVLPVLARLSGQTVNDLFDGTEIDVTCSEKKIETVSDLIQILFDIDDVITIKKRREQYTMDNPENLPFTHDVYYISINSYAVDNILRSWDQLRNVSIDEEQKKEIIDMWKHGTLDKYKKIPLRGYSSDTPFDELPFK